LKVAIVRAPFIVFIVTQSINANWNDARDNLMTKATRIHYLCKTKHEH